MAKFYDVRVAFREGGRAGPEHLRYFTFTDIEASKARVALNRAMQQAGYQRSCKDQWIVGCQIMAEKALGPTTRPPAPEPQRAAGHGPAVPSGLYGGADRGD